MDIMYFAYGSNMLSKRMLDRLSSAKFFSLAYLDDKRLVFNKQSKDGSGKANLVDEPGWKTWGVLYTVEDTEIALLDKVEGGYNRHSLEVQLPDGRPTLAEVYISTALAKESIAYDWYKNLILDGAREHNLPESYVEYLSQLPSKTR